MKTTKLTLWAGRNSATEGYRFVAEREVTEATAQDWLKIYREDEPSIIFIVSAKKPKA